MNTTTVSSTDKNRPESDLDPITLSVLISRFEDIANEMTLTLEYTARSIVLALARDFSCAVYDGRCRQIAIMDALPGHTASLHLVLQKIAEAFEGDIHEGDVYMCNSAYHNNTHIGDLVAAEPVFVDGELKFWAVTKGHQLDTGGHAPASVLGDAENLYQEGLQIPPLRVISKGEVIEDIMELYLANMRYREVLWGDLQAQFGSVHKGRLRLEELAADYADHDVDAYVEAILEHGHRFMAASIESIPDGEYHSEGWIDSDGGDRIDIPIKCKVTIDGDRAHMDYSGSGAQTESGLNGSLATLHSCASIPFLYYMDPKAPHNQGGIDHLTFHAEPGTICLAEHPASTSAATIVPSDAMHDAVNKAMAQAIPDRVPAGGCRAANIPTFAGVNEETGEAWGAMIFNNGGASGAAKDADGWPLISTINGMGCLRSQSIEQLEQLYPFLVEEMEIEPESMGFGQWNGGPGVRFAARPTKGSMEVVTFGDGDRNPPHGVLGGTPGIGGGNYVEAPDGTRRFYPASAHYHCGPDEIRVGVSTGGGGYGRPIDRDVEQVRRDVRDGLISRQTAASVFGVILSDDIDPVVDEERTKERREVLSREEYDLINPTVPGASTWLEDTMVEGDKYITRTSGN